MADGEQGGDARSLRSTIFKAGALALSLGCLASLMAFAQGAIGCGTAPEPSLRPEAVNVPAPPSASAPPGGALADPTLPTAAHPSAAAPAVSHDEAEYFPASKAGPPIRRPPPAQQAAPQPAPNAPVEQR